MCADPRHRVPIRVDSCRSASPFAGPGTVSSPHPEARARVGAPFTGLETGPSPSTVPRIDADCCDQRRRAADARHRQARMIWRYVWNRSSA